MVTDEYTSTDHWRYEYLTSLPQEDVEHDHPMWLEREEEDPLPVIRQVTEGDEDIPTGTMIVYCGSGPWADAFLPGEAQ